MKSLVSIVCIVFVLCSCSVQSKGIASKGYEESLQTVIEYLISGEEPSIKQIQDVIPKTEDDFFTFYSYTEKDEKNNIAFYELNNLILKYALKGESNILKSYLLLSEFVDGEYAESYFEDVETVIKKNNETFCNLFTQLPKKKIYRLSNLNNKYCK